VPVTLARKLPSTVLEHERLEVPEIVMLGGVREHTRLVEFVVTLRLTVPEKPPSGVTVIPLVPGAPGLVFTVVGLAVRLKSWTLNVTVVEWVSIMVVPVIDGVVPVTVTMKVPPLVKVHDSVELPVPVMVGGAMLHGLPTLRVTIPLKPLTP
jgi:hypothetical protein